MKVVGELNTLGSLPPAGGPVGCGVMGLEDMIVKAAVRV
jgi:hypothetical protein